MKSMEYFILLMTICLSRDPKFIETCRSLDLSQLIINRSVVLLSNENPNDVEKFIEALCYFSCPIALTNSNEPLKINNITNNDGIVCLSIIFQKCSEQSNQIL